MAPETRAIPAKIQTMITSLRGYKILLLNNVLHTLSGQNHKVLCQPSRLFVRDEVEGGEMGKVPLLTLAIEAATPSTGQFD